MASSGDFVDGTVPPDLRARVLHAAADELTRWGVERFNVGALSARHGIDERVIYRYWGDGQRLLLDVATHESDEVITTPDTGWLRGDLEAMALSVGVYVNGRLARRLMRAMIVDDRAHLATDTRTVFWRRRFETVRAVLDNAAVRGELRDGVDPLSGVQILLAPINVRALYTDDPVDDAYCLAVADLAWHALARR